MASKKLDTNDERDGFRLLARTERLILELLLENSSKEQYGLELIEASKGALKRGSIYVTLQRMEAKGLVESREEPRPAPEVGIPRRMYKATGHGARALRTDELSRAGGLLESL